jgi:mono/diheme cytochrome c family protein
MIRVAIVLLVGALVAGCTRSNMDAQPKYHEYESGKLFRDGKVLQKPVPGTVARGDLALADEAKQRPELSVELLERGRAQFDVFCQPCHDRTGSGHGIVVQRGFPQPPDFEGEKLRAADDQHFFDVITNGYGAMYAHRDRIRPRDRWAVVAYIRALQLSRHATLADVPPDEQSRLNQETGR